MRVDNPHEGKTVKVKHFWINIGPYSPDRRELPSINIVLHGPPTEADRAELLKLLDQFEFVPDA